MRVSVYMDKAAIAARERCPIIVDRRDGTIRRVPGLVIDGPSILRYAPDAPDGPAVWLECEESDIIGTHPEVRE